MFVLHTPNPNLRVKLSMSVYVCFLPKRSAAFSLKITLAPQCNSTELRRTKLVAGLLYFGLSFPAPCLFWVSGHGCGNGGIYHPPGSAPNGLPTWVKLGLILGGGAGWSGPARVGRVQIFLFARTTMSIYSQWQSHDNPWQSRLPVAIEIWPWKMNYGGIR